jgi:predicted N-acetyltransferase YhbS
MKYALTRPPLDEARPLVLALWREVFGALPESRYPWLYESNPAGEAILHVLRENGSDQLVGSTAAFPRTLHSRGEPLNAAIAGDLMVVQGHRSAGPAISLQRALLDTCAGQHLDIVYGFPNPKSTAVMRRVGYEPVASLLQLILPLKSHYFLRKHIRAPWLSRPASILVDLALGLRPGVMRYGRLSSRECFVTDSFDRDFDELWTRIASRYALIGEKTAEYLDWRYRRCPSRAYRVFGVRDPGSGSLLGYVIFTEAKDRVQIVDFAWDEASVKPEEIIALFVRMQQPTGAESIAVSIAGSADVSRRFRNVGFRARGETNPLLMYRPPGSRAKLDEIKRGTWYLVAGDNDT